MAKKKVKRTKSKRVIPGFPNYYITKDGRIWSKPRLDLQGNKRKGKWLKPSVYNSGYLYVVLRKNGNRYFRTIHHLVLKTYVEARPDSMECRHLDGNPANNNLKNLCWGTKKENMQDRKKHGTECMPDNSGERNGQAKLTEEDIRNIVTLYEVGLWSQKEIAESYNITTQYVGCIVRGKAWRHLWQ